MHIKELSIDGFGIFADCTIKDLPNGLIVVFGNNECGKSTLMQFFRMVLFGPARGKSNSYPPLAGGLHGGRLVVEMEDGREVLVERIGKKLTMTDSGKRCTEEASHYLLNNLDRQTYERVFAMGLEDLQGFDVLTEENAQARLMAAGAGLGAASVPETLKKLNRMIEELIKPGGRVQKLPKLKKRLSELQGEIARLRKSDSIYSEMALEQRNLREQLTQKKSTRENLVLQKSRLEKLQSMRQPWVRLTQNKKEITGVKHAQAFPVNGEKRLQEISQELNGYQDSLQEVLNNLQTFHSSRDQLDRGLAFLEMDGEIEALAAEREKFATALKEIHAQRNEVKRTRELFHRRLAELGPNWDETRFDNVDTSVQTRQRVQDYKKDFDETNRQLTIVRSEKDRAGVVLKEAERNENADKKTYLSLKQPVFTDPDELRKQRRQFRAAQTVLQNLSSTTAAIESQESMLLGMQGQGGVIDNSDSPVKTLLPAWLPWVIFATGLIIGLGFTLLPITGSSAISWMLAGFSLLFGVILAGVLQWMNWRVQQDALSISKSSEAQEVERKVAVNTVLEKLNQDRESASVLTEELEQLLSDLSISDKTVRDLNRLNQFGDQLEEYQEELAEWIKAKAEYERSEEARKTAEQAQLSASQKLDSAVKRRSDLIGDWGGWLEDRGFDRELRPEQFDVVLEAIDSARQSRDVALTQASNLQGMEQYLASVTEKIANLSESAKLSSGQGSVTAETIDVLSDRLRRANECDKEYRSYSVKIETAKASAEHLYKQIEARKSDRQKLFDTVDASDEIEFAACAESYHAWKELDVAIGEDELKLMTAAGNKEALLQIEGELTAKTPELVKVELDGVQERLKEIESEISDSEQKIGECTKTLRDMAVDDQLSRKLQEYSGVEEQIKRLTKKWAALAVYRTLLEKAREVHERDRQPQVIQSADRYLQIMVGDRYRLVSSMDEEALQLEGQDRKRKMEDHWSSGLSDQTYLATRLGMATQFASQSEPLPLILDDVLVRFDPTRRRAAAEALLVAAQHQQVFLFSCHPEVVQELGEVLSARHEGTVPLRSFEIVDGTLSPFERT